MNSVAIFEELSEDQMGLLGPLFEAFSCHAGSVILQQGTPAEFLYLIISGKVEVSFKPYDGNPITVSHVEKGGLSVRLVGCCWKRELYVFSRGY